VDLVVGSVHGSAEVIAETHPEPVVGLVRTEHNAKGLLYPKRQGFDQQSWRLRMNRGIGRRKVGS